MICFRTALKVAVLTAACGMATHVSAEQTDEPFFGRTDPTQFKPVDYGGGTIYEMTVLPGDIMSTNVAYIRSGILPARTGIGTHTHRNMEEIYIVLDGPAEFTLDGATALLPDRSSVLCPMGSSHALYNNSDETIRFVALAVTRAKGVVDENIVYGPVPGRNIPDSGTIRMENQKKANATYVSPPPFRWVRFDWSLTKWVGPAHLGSGKILNTRPWLDGNFETNWVRVGHCILPPGTSIGYHRHDGIEETYFILEGMGRMTVNDVTRDVRSGDAVPCTIHDSHGIYNNSNADLDLFVFMVAMERGKLDATNHGDDLSGR